MKKQETQITTIIGAGAVCEGDFSAKGSARIDGVINGSVKVTGNITIGATGCVHGDVDALSAVIGGEVNGNVTAPERVELIETARLIGDITTSVIVIDEKAIFHGKCDMNQEVPGKKAKPAAKAVRAGRKTAKAAIEEALKEMEAAQKAEAASAETPRAEVASEVKRADEVEATTVENL